MPLQPHHLPLYQAACSAVIALAALALARPAVAAPSEGTAGQMVSARSAQRVHGSAPPVARIEARPLWSELTHAQQQALQPLAPYWSQLTEERKRKWLSISKNYPALSPAEQAKLHQRMSQWVTLSQQQRAQARQSFQQIHALPPQQRSAEWQAYQALTPEEKRRLAAQAGVKPTAAPVIKPAAKPKLTAVAGPRWAEGAPAAPQHPTLLPQAARPAPEASPYEDDPAE